MRPVWNYGIMDVLRKETLIILVCCFRFIVGRPLAAGEPRGHHNSSWKVSKHPHVSTTKGIFKTRLGTGPSVWPNRREDTADVLISKQRQTRNAFRRRGIFTLRGPDGEDIRNVVFAQRGVSRPINTTGPSRFPPDSRADPRQINASRTMRREGRRLPLCPRSSEGDNSGGATLSAGGFGCVLSGEETFPAIHRGRGNAVPPITRLCMWARFVSVWFPRFSSPQFLWPERYQGGGKHDQTQTFISFLRRKYNRLDLWMTSHICNLPGGMILRLLKINHQLNNHEDVTASSYSSPAQELNS